MNQDIDWIDDISWQTILSGISWIFFIPFLITLVGMFFEVKLVENWLFQLILVLAAVVIGSCVSAWDCNHRIGRVASAMICVFISASIFASLSLTQQGMSDMAVFALYGAFCVLGLLSSLAVLPIKHAQSFLVRIVK